MVCKICNPESFLELGGVVVSDALNKAEEISA